MSKWTEAVFAWEFHGLSQYHKLTPLLKERKILVVYDLEQNDCSLCVLIFNETSVGDAYLWTRFTLIGDNLCEFREHMSLHPLLSFNKCRRGPAGERWRLELMQPLSTLYWLKTVILSFVLKKRFSLTAEDQQISRRVELTEHSEIVFCSSFILSVI